MCLLLGPASQQSSLNCELDLPSVEDLCKSRNMCEDLHDLTFASTSLLLKESIYAVGEVTS